LLILWQWWKECIAIIDKHPIRSYDKFATI
jgi:hypothetical protein